MPRSENLINLEAVHKSFGVRPVLDGVSLGVARGDRIGVVGLNGGGKTTLIEVVAGIAPVDAGRVSHVRDLRSAVVNQRTELSGATVGESVLGSRQAGHAHEWAANPRIREVLNGLGISALGMDTSIERLSGGERRRIALAAALINDLDLLILDEPTNHLDAEGIQWLAEHLHQRSSALVVVTHDRWFLDTVCTQMWEVVDGTVEQSEGGYADWVFARAERARLAATAEQKRQNLARKELAWLRRGAPARTSKPRYRIEAAEALIADVPPPRDSAELLTFAKRRLGKTVLELEDVSLEVAGRSLLRNVTWRIGPGERIALVGANGSGKTSLLRILTGETAPPAGVRQQGVTVRLAYLTQELHDIPEDLRVLEAVEQVARRVQLGARELSASQLAERFGFGAQRQWTPVADLSGGERRRLQLARLLMAEPNVLLLDEPTNDLDIETLQQLEDLLDGWPGTLVVVSHDRYLIDRVCDQVVALFGDGAVTPLVGGMPEYLERRAADGLRASASAPSRPNSRAADERLAKKELAKLERQLERLHTQEKKLHEALAEAATDAERLLTLDTELRALAAEIADVEERWLELVDTAS